MPKLLDPLVWLDVVSQISNLQNQRDASRNCQINCNLNLSDLTALVYEHLHRN